MSLLTMMLSILWLLYAYSNYHHFHPNSGTFRYPLPLNITEMNKLWKSNKLISVRHVWFVECPNIKLSYHINIFNKWQITTIYRYSKTKIISVQWNLSKETAWSYMRGGLSSEPFFLWISYICAWFWKYGILESVENVRNQLERVRTRCGHGIRG